MADQTQMDDFNEGLCWAYRHPPGGAKPLKLGSIRKLVRKTNGKRPTVQAISLAARTFKDDKQKRGRKLGKRATTKEEDKKILQKLKQLKPPGHYIDSRILHTALPKKLQEKIGKQTCINRLAEKGFNFEEKNNKDDPSAATRKKRVAFCKKHEDKTYQQWQTYCQGVADLSDT